MFTYISINKEKCGGENTAEKCMCMSQSLCLQWREFQVDRLCDKDWMKF